jgi:cytochrome oxidase Cu insertion factor (SCO1/SenC/PrrC family)
MKVTFICLSILSLAVIIGCAQEKGFRTGMIMSPNKVTAGIKVPQINFQDPSGTCHQLFRRFGDEYTLVVFFDKKTGDTENAALIRTARALFRREEPATIVEIIGGDSGCTPNDQTYVLKRDIPRAKLITLCDLSGDTRKHYSVDDAASVYLIDPSGVLVETAAYSRIDGLLARMRLLAQKLAYQQVEYCND